MNLLKVMSCLLFVLALKPGPVFSETETKTKHALVLLNERIKELEKDLVRSKFEVFPGKHYPYNYGQHNVGGRSQVDSPEECMSHCLKNSRCTSIVWTRDWKGCHFLGEKVAPSLSETKGGNKVSAVLKETLHEEKLKSNINERLDGFGETIDELATKEALSSIDKKVDRSLNDSLFLFKTLAGLEHEFCEEYNHWDTFDKNNKWMECPKGKFLKGMYKSNCDGLKCIEKIKCCTYTGV